MELSVSHHFNAEAAAKFGSCGAWLELCIDRGIVRGRRAITRASAGCWRRSYGRYEMAKSRLSGATDAMKTVAGAALGAAAVAATGVIVTKVAGAMRETGNQLEEATPAIQKFAGNTVARPLLPKRQKRAAASRKATSAKRSIAARKAAKKRRLKR
jgi:hypothetical protein